MLFSKLSFGYDTMVLCHGFIMKDLVSGVIGRELFLFFTLYFKIGKRSGVSDNNFSFLKSLEGGFRDRDTLQTSIIFGVLFKHNCYGIG